MQANKDKPKTHSERLLFLALLVLLGLAYRRTLKQKAQEVWAAILATAMIDGVFHAELLPAARARVAETLNPLIAHFDNQMIDQLPLTVTHAVRTVDPKADDAAAQEAARKMILAGALGVPFAAVVAVAVYQAHNDIMGSVFRLAMSGANEAVIQEAIDKILADKLYTKLSNEASMQLSAAFTEAVRAVAAAQPKITELRWNLSPALDNHCKVCAPRDGNVYAKTDPIWDEIPVHINCGCFPSPVQGEE
jgi:hypothetical protein